MEKIKNCKSISHLLYLFRPFVRYICRLYRPLMRSKLYPKIVYKETCGCRCVCDFTHSQIALNERHNRHFVQIVIMIVVIVGIGSNNYNCRWPRIYPYLLRRFTFTGRDTHTKSTFHLALCCVGTRSGSMPSFEFLRVTNVRQQRRKAQNFHTNKSRIQFLTWTRAPESSKMNSVELLSLARARVR